MILFRSFWNWAFARCLIGTHNWYALSLLAPNWKPCQVLCLQGFHASFFLRNSSLHISRLGEPPESGVYINSISFHQRFCNAVDIIHVYIHVEFIIRSPYGWQNQVRASRKQLWWLTHLKVKRISKRKRRIFTYMDHVNLVIWILSVFPAFSYGLTFLSFPPGNLLTFPG